MRRHRVAFFAASGAIAVLLLGLACSTYLFLREKAAVAMAEAATQTAEQANARTLQALQAAQAARAKTELALKQSEVAEAEAKHQREVATEEIQRKVKAEKRIAELETEIDRERRYMVGIADAFREQQAELEKLQLPDDEKLNRALAAVAEREKLSEEAYWAAIKRFVAAVRANPKADFRDRALADFAEKRSFAAAVATVAAQISPSGVIIVRGVPRLMIGKRPFEVGARFTATYKNQEYELELVAVDRTSFTLRHHGEEITRPIKSSK